MTLDGAINFYETDMFVIYTMNSTTTGQYCVVLPKNETGTYNMLVDLHMKSLFDAVSGGSKTKQDLIDEVSGEYESILSKYASGILVLPMFSEELLKNTVISGDKQKMFDETKKIGAITSELYKKLTDAGVEKQKIDQKIIMVEKTEEDKKFVEWLEEQMPNFVEGLDYQEFSPKKEEKNPFMNGNPFDIASNVSEVPDVSTSVPKQETVIPNNIFDAVSPSIPAEPVVPDVPKVETPVVPSENESPASGGVDLFGTPVASNTSNVVSSPSGYTPSVATSNEEENHSNVDVPKPVSNVELEGTTTFNPIPDERSEKVESEDSVDEGRSGSKGFANLLILVVILVGVTIASVELGKFLYSVYGAGV